MFQFSDNLQEKALSANIIALENIITKSMENFYQTGSLEISFEDYESLTPGER